MATLPQIRPGAANTTGLPTTGSIIANPGGATALSDSNNTTFDGQNTNTSGAYQYGRELGDTPADFGSIITLTIQFTRGWQSAPSNSTWDSLQARIVSGGTILAAANSGGTFQTIDSNITSVGATAGSNVGFSYVNTAATKTQWDAAVVQYQWNRTRSKGGDSLGCRVYEAFINGTYNVAVESHSGSGSISHAHSTIATGVKKGANAGSISHAHSVTATGTAPVFVPEFVKRIAGVNTKAAGATIDITVPAAGVAAGNDIIVVAYWRNAPATLTVTDDGGNSYSLIDQLADDTSSMGMLVYKASNVNALVDGDLIMLDSGNSADTTKVAIALEVTGAPQLDVKAKAAGTSSFADSGLTATTANPDEFLLGLISISSGTDVDAFSPTSSESWTIEAVESTTGGGTNGQINPLYKTVSSTGTYKASGDIFIGSPRWVAFVLAFQQATSDRSGSGSTSHASSTSAAGIKTSAGVGTSTNASSVTATGRMEAAGAATGITHSSAASATGQAEFQDAAAITHAHATSAAGQIEAQGVASIAHTEATTADGAKEGAGVGTSTNASSGVGTGVKDTSDSASIAHASSTSATGSIGAENFSGSGAINHASSVAADGTMEAIGSAVASAASGVAATGAMEAQGAGTIGHASATVADGAAEMAGAATASNASATSAQGSPEMQGIGTSTDASDAAALGAKTASGAATVSQTHDISATGTNVGGGIAIITHNSAVSGTGTKATSGVGTSTDTSSAVADGLKAFADSATIAAASSTSASGEKAGAGAGAVVGTQDAVADGIRTSLGAGTVSQTHSVIATGAVGAENFTGSGAITQAHGIVATGAAEFQDTASIAHGSGTAAAGIAQRQGVGVSTNASVGAATGNIGFVEVLDNGWVIEGVTAQQIADYFYVRGRSTDVGVLAVMAAEARELGNYARARRLAKASVLLAARWASVDHGVIAEQISTRREFPLPVQPRRGR